MLDEDQVAVYVIMEEIRPVVEPDHDPVGGCSSGVSLLDLKSQSIPLSSPAPVRAVFHLLALALSGFHTLYIPSLCRMHNLRKLSTQSDANIITKPTFKVRDVNAL